MSRPLLIVCFRHIKQEHDNNSVFRKVEEVKGKNPEEK